MASIRLTLPQALSRAFSAYKAGELVAAEEICRHILSVKPEVFEALHLLAVVQAARGRNDEAVASYDRALALRPNHAEALYNRGVALQALNRNDEAVASYDRALAIRPDFAEAINNRANILQALKRRDEALASYDRALSIRADDPDTLNNRGNALRELKRYEEALASYDRALSLRPGYAEALNNRGVSFYELKRYDEALASYDRALGLRPDYAEALNNRGLTLHKLKRYHEALESFDRAFLARPGYAEALNNRGPALQETKRYGEALASYDRALSLRPDYADAHYNRGLALQELKRYDEALASFDRALSFQPDHADALDNRGNSLRVMRRYDEAMASFDRALATTPDHAYALSGAADCAMKICDWDRRERVAAELAAHVLEKTSIVAPFVLLGLSGDGALQLRCARSYIENEVPVPPRPLWRGEIWHHDRLRIAYLSADLRTHAVGHLTAGLFEEHDHSRFEIIGVSFGNDDGSALRKRLVKAFEAFHDVRTRSDAEIAKFLYDHRIDIAVDLMGYTTDSRPGIFSHRPAPIQASYLGFAATTGADFIDYVLADEVAVPFADQKLFAERIVHLPHSFQVNDRKRAIATRTPTRAEMGLPDHGFVLCCFNNNWKIAPEMFDVWMRLLHGLEGSVLWLLADNESAERNLRKEARQRGIDASRLVFAGRVPLDEHLARHRLADLFLDTLPYNAGTTASDALWAGLPVITCKGTAFVGRMAASLLKAIGLPELIAASLEEYEALALKLARQPALLAETKARLLRHRETYPLFDTARFARHIESAFTTMAEIWQRGEAPRGFRVEPVE